MRIPDVPWLEKLDGDSFTSHLRHLSPQSLIYLTRMSPGPLFSESKWARLATELANRLERTGCAPPTEEE